MECNSFGEGCAYGLDDNAFQIQLAEQLPEHRPLVVAIGGVGGLGRRHENGATLQPAATMRLSR